MSGVYKMEKKAGSTGQDQRRRHIGFFSSPASTTTTDLMERSEGTDVSPRPSTPVSQDALEVVDEVRFAIVSKDWDRLRRLSAQPGGFGSEGRKEAWPFLLHAVESSGPVDLNEKTEPSQERETDTISVAPEVHDVSPPEEAISNAHPDESQVRLDTERSFVMYPAERSPSQKVHKDHLYDVIVAVLRKRPKLRYFQGYHDVISVLYLTLQDSPSRSPRSSALLLSCAEKISLHRTRDSMGVGLDPLVGYLRILKRLLREADPDLAASIEHASTLPYFALSNILTLFAHDTPTLPLIQRIFDFLLCRPPIFVVYLEATMILSRKAEILKLEAEGEDGMMHSILSQLPKIVADGPSEVQPSRGRTVSLPSRSRSRGQQSLSPSSANHATRSISTERAPPTVISDVSATEDGNSTFGGDSTLVDLDDAMSRASVTVVEDTQPSFESKASPSQPSGTAISSILQAADDLFARIPPTHPGVAVSQILGPQSVVTTWSEIDYDAHLSEASQSSTSLHLMCLPSDSVAEEMVVDKSLVVFPYDPSEDWPESDGEYEKKPLGRRSRRPRFIDISHLEKRTILAGIVLLLAVGLAVYGTDKRSRARLLEWRRLAAWTSGLAASLGFTVMEDFGALDSEI